MKSKGIDYWVEYIQGLHLRSIDLSLERVKEVYELLYPRGIDSVIVNVAGTNGKGSCAEMLSSVYAAAGYSVGKYTSPHLVDFNERYEINRHAVNDPSLIDAFERVEAARRDIPLTFFEFGTLIAIDLFAQAELDVIIMEVGLGGRLDAVNILDADVAMITNISIDHTSWLGDTVEQIALEKAGVARADRPVVVASKSAPASLFERLEDIGAELHCYSDSYNAELSASSQTWTWFNGQKIIQGLPWPFAQSGVQIDNAAGVLMVVECLSDRLPVSSDSISRGLASAQLAGRCQLLEKQPSIIFDVSHNEASVIRLSQFIQRHMKLNGLARCLVVCGMLKDKDIEKSLMPMQGIADAWFLSSIHNERGASAIELSAHLPVEEQVECFSDVVDAYMAARSAVKKCDCLVVFGSFHIVGDIIKYRR